MFKETNHNIQRNLFSDASLNLSGRASKLYDDPKAWHNQFYELVTSKVDETVFQPLYKTGNMGAPTKGLCRLVAMMVYKEGCGCSDAELEQRVDLDLQLRRALGLFSLDEQAPSIDGYYLFRRRLVEHEQRTGEDLFAKCFVQLTGSQVKKFKISGKAVRMDSKLIGSNIAWYSRYELVHRTLVKSVSREAAAKLKEPLRTKVLDLLDENAKNTVYVSSTGEIESKFEAMGRVIHGILAAWKLQSGLLHKVFHQQYDLVKDKDQDGKPRGPKYARPKDKEDIKAASVQNPNDPEAEYRKKSDQQVKGYSTNITETTAEEGKPSLIVDVQVEGATTADNSYVQGAIENAQAVTGNEVDTLYCDGAYQSPDNRQYAEANGIEIVTSGIQGQSGRYELSLDQAGNLTVIDKQTGQIVAAEKRGERWRIKVEGKKNPYRYFSTEQIQREAERQRLKAYPKEKLNRRNNVEASIFQYSFHTRNNKTRYRGLAKHRMQARSRSMWINLRRLMIFQLSALQCAFLAVLSLLARSWAALGQFGHPGPAFGSKLISTAIETLFAPWRMSNPKFATC